MITNGKLPASNIYYTDGALLGAMFLSEKSQTILDNGDDVCVIYHTPQLLRDRIGSRSGSFTLQKSGGQIITGDAQQFNEYMQIQAAVNAARTAEATAAVTAKAAFAAEARKPNA